MNAGAEAAGELVVADHRKPAGEANLAAVGMTGKENVRLKLILNAGKVVRKVG